MSATDGGQTQENVQDRNTQIIVAGAALGALIGMISSYLYTRAAEENGNADAAARGSVSTGQALALLLAILSVVRQIAELGKPRKEDKPGKK